VVWISETRPIRGAGSLDSLTRAAPPKQIAGKGRQKDGYGCWCVQRPNRNHGRPVERFDARLTQKLRKLPNQSDRQN